MGSEDKFTISETDEDFDFWLKQDFVGDDLRQELSSKNILILPHTGYAGTEEYYFMKGSQDFFQHLQDNESADLRPDILWDEDGYQELSLRHDVINIPHLLIEYALFALPTGVLIALLVDFARKRNELKENTRIRSEITVVDKENRKAHKITYEGSRSDYESTLKRSIQTIERLRKEDSSDSK